MTNILVAINQIRNEIQSEPRVVVPFFNNPDIFISYKHRILCYLLSHVNSLSSETVQISLLKSIATITNKAKIQILLPTIQTIITKSSSADPDSSFSEISEEFTTRVLSCYDSFAASYLNETAAGWDIFLQLLRRVFCAGTRYKFSINWQSFDTVFFRYANAITGSTRTCHRDWIVFFTHSTKKIHTLRNPSGSWFSRWFFCKENFFTFS